MKEAKNTTTKIHLISKMIKVGEHIALDIVGITKEYDPSVFERVIHEIAKAAKVTILNVSKSGKSSFNFSTVKKSNKNE